MRPLVWLVLPQGVAMPEPTQLNIQDLSFWAEGRAVLQVKSLTLPATGISVILGPNGAGKSVLLRLLHGILIPNSGHVAFAPALARQAMVFQKPVLLRRSVAANIAFALQASGQPAAMLEPLLHRARLHEQAGQPARTLSGGEQQRLALFRALATAPDVLFMDEPTASLDPSATLDIEQEIQTAADAGTKIVMVTHNIAQARRLAGDLSILIDGQIEDHGPAARVFAQPATQPTQAFLDGQLPVSPVTRAAK